MTYRLPRWKQWVLRHVIGDFEAASLGLYGWLHPERDLEMVRNVWVRMANPGGVNTAEPAKNEVASY